MAGSRGNCGKAGAEKTNTLSTNESGHGNRTLARYAWLLDSSIRLPGGFRIGLDGIIGLIPGVGDVLSAILSSAIVLHAYRRGAGKSVLTRMLGNIGIELVVGAIPVVGDLFDFAYRANIRNVALLEEFEANPRSARARSLWQVGLAACALFAVLTGIALVAIWMLIALVSALNGAILAA